MKIAALIIALVLVSAIMIGCTYEPYEPPASGGSGGGSSATGSSSSGGGSMVDDTQVTDELDSTFVVDEELDVGEPI